MSDTSARFALPWLQPGQAQKEAYHNEALAILDAVSHAAVESVGAVEPPAVPLPGQCWALGEAPAGDWAGQGHRLAAWTDGGWRFITPVAGMTLWSVADQVPARWTGAEWAVGRIDARAVHVNGVQILGPRRPAIADPVNGATADGEARAAISLILGALRAHGLISG